MSDASGDFADSATSADAKGAEQPCAGADVGAGAGAGRRGHKAPNVAMHSGNRQTRVVDAA